MRERDLFGNELPYKHADNINRRGQRNPKPKGYAGRPGSGPQGERCNTCAHYVVSPNGRYRKCALLRKHWTRSYGTDILARSPACDKWQKPTEGETDNV